MKSDGRMTVARMMFYNHTACGCVSRDGSREAVRPHTPAPHLEREEEPLLERDEEASVRTSPPELRRLL